MKPHKFIPEQDRHSFPVRCIATGVDGLECQAREVEPIHQGVIPPHPFVAYSHNGDNNFCHFCGSEYALNGGCGKLDTDPVHTSWRPANPDDPYKERRKIIRERRWRLDHQESAERSLLLREHHALWLERKMSLQKECAALGHEWELLPDNGVNHPNPVTGDWPQRCRHCDVNRPINSSPEGAT